MTKESSDGRPGMGRPMILEPRGGKFTFREHQAKLRRLLNEGVSACEAFRLAGFNTNEAVPIHPQVVYRLALLDIDARSKRPRSN